MGENSRPRNTMEPILCASCSACYALKWCGSISPKNRDRSDRSSQKIICIILEAYRDEKTYSGDPSFDVGPAGVLQRSVEAQTITGSVNGTVTDPTGAVIPNAKVTATNVDTGIETPTTTNSDGIYNIRFLQIGNYKVTVDARVLRQRPMDRLFWKPPRTRRSM